ncbi:ADP-ribosylation factor protein 3 [Conglomerata obtusa]
MIKKILKSKNEYKIIFIGLDNAGKTTILHNLFDKKINNIAPTFGYQIHNLEYNYKERLLKITALDIGGQSCFRKYISNFYEKLDGIVFVTDCCDTRSYAEWFTTIMDDNEKIPFIMLDNKCDLKKDVDANVMKSLCEYGKYFLCSGKTGFNLQIAFNALLDMILQNNEDLK